MRSKIEQLSRVANDASDEEVEQTLREIVEELDAEIGFIEQKYG